MLSGVVDDYVNIHEEMKMLVISQVDRLRPKECNFFQHATMSSIIPSADPENIP